MQLKNLILLLLTVVLKKKSTKQTTANNIKAKDISSKIANSLKQVGNLKVHFFSLDDLNELITTYAKVWVFFHQNQFFLSYKNKVIGLENLSLEKVGSLLSKKSIKWYGYDLKSRMEKIFSNRISRC